jgi:transcription-repair coupling factor (superfamily II helicase)
MKLNLKTIINKINSLDFGNIKLDNLNEFIWPFLTSNLKQNLVLFVNTNSQIGSLANQIAYINKDAKIITFPAWDCQTYDMSNPNLEIQAQRVFALKQLASLKPKQKAIIITNTRALINKTINLDELTNDIILTQDKSFKRDALIEQLLEQGFKRVENVYQTLEFAFRGDILDIFPNGYDEGFRIEFFDDEIESIHTLDIKTQRRVEKVKECIISQNNELILNKKTIANFTQNYLELFPAGHTDAIYQEIKQGKFVNNRFHFLNLFYKTQLKSLLDYLPKDYAIFYADSMQQSIDDFYEELNLSFNARSQFVEEFEDQITNKHFDTSDIYRPVKPNSLYLTKDEVDNFLQAPTISFNDTLNNSGQFTDTSLENHIPYNKKSLNKTPLDTACVDIKKWKSEGYKIIISCLNKVSAEHISKALESYDISLLNLENYQQAKSVENEHISLIKSPIEFGFIDTKEKLVFLTEQDIFGAKQKIKKRTKSSSKKIIEHLNQLKIKDLVVHAKHGIGRFLGLETIKTSQSEAQDFAVIEYAEGNKLFIPIINLDSLSLYAHAEGNDVKIDRLGGTAFAGRKEKVKQKLLEIAAELIAIASKRSLLKGFSFAKVDGMYDEFSEGFEYMLTEDQESCINDVINDMYKPQPMDRLVIGDVGFGKTEVALRACFVAASNSKQVAVIVPTTLLARQHNAQFVERFEYFGFSVAMLSRLNSAKVNKEIKQKLKTGEIDIVIGTHALLAKDIEFKNLGLLIIDEEQRFGVKHKEKLKAMRSNIDILTLSATPIPRTLQMSVSGIRELSLITTPPVDRLPIKTAIMKYDSTTLKQAILKELYRNGQTYIIAPRVEGIYEIAEKISALVPQAKIKVAHGQMNREDLEDTMDDFSNAKFDILIATTIIESGIDIPNANTMIVFDAHKFGLAQLYQIRGRIGRSKQASFAYFLIPSHQKISSNAELRLKILKKLDNIGAGFTLASYDMDLRGPGNILGSEQSGHIKEVGFTMYNNMLNDAIKSLKSNGKIEEIDDDFSTNINIKWSFLLPESYINDANERLNTYRRLSEIHDFDELNEISDELTDRFGKIPEEVQNLLTIVGFKITAKALNIESIEAGDKGILFKFNDNKFKGSGDLIKELLARPMEYKLRPDQKIFYNCKCNNKQQTMLNIKNTLAFVEKFK